MGLFDFAVNMGKKLFGKDDDPAAAIKKQIEADNPGIQNLDVSFDEGKVVLSGDAESAEALEKAVLIAGNVQGVSDVSADQIKAPKQEAKVEYYVIEKGDTLSAIAKRFLGKASDYPKIFDANREVIKDPNLIYPGQKIRIPLN
ncbi:MAG: peptidoglycan-binding protein LysM [Candidatus Thiodiazotropha sp. (ex Notomyrtea botanica)]|nr:peptidoglycan-binding protein LysM [Candidatus Thiodiazotropha sp. (ex Notomyrtea botanica)]